MNDSHDSDLDRTMRRAAHDSLDAHRRSIERSDIESARQAADASARLSAGRSRGRRRAVAALAAAAVVALVGALVLVTGGPSDERVSVAPGSSQVEDVPTTPRSTSATGTESSTSAAPGEVLVETLGFDVNGDPLVGFDDDDGVDASRSPFAEVLRDHLINGSDILGESVAEREEQLDTGRLRIHTTLDPSAQAAAESARTELPPNSQGIDTAIVSLDTASGAVRAMTGAPNVQGGDRRVNMAVTPRQTGSAVGYFIIAAAVEAGVQADDQIDARRGCQFPSDVPGDPGFVINAGVVGFVGTIRDVAARGLLCGTARLSHIVGLENVIDTTYRMAASPYLDSAGSTLDRSRLEPFPALAVGANEMSPLDMASGMQTLANEGVHHDPYFVEYIDDADGNRLYTHRPDGTRELETNTSLETIDILKGVLQYGTGRRYTVADDRPAFGITGTQSDNTNAWFVGATPQLTTAVWVGDPDAYTQMIAIPEFEADGIPRVQGGTYPAQIWKTFTDNALNEIPPIDWASPPPPARPNARLVLPGVECRLDDPTNDPSPTNTPQEITPTEPITTVDVSTAIVPCD